MLNHGNLDNFNGQSSSIRIFRAFGDHEVFSDKDVGLTHKFLEIHKGKTDLLLEK